ncbi:MAG: single-stranded DNA-binding protein [Deltaproteobacteria bacterium]|jgi:single-strand DNA-binding protein|nr:single-stranded DNA-binding protein [Deltaproteobacteria bacterium]
MARSLNKVMLIGRLGADPEIRYTQDGTSVCTFNIATNRRVKRNEQWEEETDWHRAVAWRQTADMLGKFLHKGSLVYVEGSLRTRSWTDQSGNKRFMTEVVVNDFVLLEPKGDKGGGGEFGYDLDAAAPPMDEEVPF